jgi:hypothetical protein
MTKLGNEIARIVATDSESFSIKIEFDDGVMMDIPMGHIFNKPKGLAAEVLRGGMFDKCFLESGSLAWPNGLELCPDAMRMWAEEKLKGLNTRRKQA